MKKHFWISFLTIFLLTFISVAYASFSSVLTITGEATVAKDTTAPTCGSWYLRDSSLTTQEAYDQNKFINAGTNTTWTNTDKTLFIECTDNMDGEYGCINVDTVTTNGSVKRYFKDVKNYTTSIKSDSNTITVTLKDAYLNERTCTLPVGGSNPYIDKEGPTVTITRSAANKFTYSATDNMSSSVTPQYMVTTSSTKPAIDSANWSSTASEVTIDNSAAKTYYVWAKDGVNITNSTISTYLLTKSQGTGTTLNLKYQNNSGATLSTGYVLNGTQVYSEATPSTGYNTALIKKDSTTAATGTGTNSVNTTITVNAATTISSSATANSYTIAYTMNGGPNPTTKPTSGTYNSNVNISNPGSKSITITPNANSSGATVGSAVVTTQTFAGWTSTTMQGNAQSGSTTSNYASWDGSSTTNTYFKNLRNDTGTVTMVANWNTSATTLPTLTAPSGYTCKWYDTQGTSGGNELGGSGTQYTPSATSGSTINVYARCTANTYYVYYNQGLATGGWSTSTYATQSRTYPNSVTLRTNSMTKSNTTANSYTVTYNQGTATSGWDASTYGTQTSVNTTSYTANGWTTGSTNLNDPDYANGATFGASNTTNLTLYPNFTTSTTNGGVTTRTNSMTKSNSADSDSYTLTFKQGTATSAAPSAITNKKYTSYTANGWTTTSGSTSRTYANNTATGALSSNITLYPCFSQTVNQKSITLPAAATKSNTNLGTVTFNYNGSGAAATTSTAYTTYAFNGWYTASSGGTKLGNASATYTPSASIDVYPQFTGTAHSATFPSPTRTGYTFAGWWTASSGGTQVTSYTGSSNVEYYAHWTPITYTVVYNKSNTNETGTLPSNQSATYDVALTLGTNSMSRPNSADSDSYTLTFKQGTATSAAPSAITNKKYTSYTANGWATSANAGRSYTSGQSVSNLTSTNNGTYNLYTSWNSQVNQKSITLPSAATKNNTNLGTVTFNYNGSGTADTTSTGYTSYSFTGWYTSQTGGTKLGDAGATYTPSASIDVYPQFSSTAHSATFPSSPSRTGYVFAGWYTAASGGTQVTSYTGTSAVTYYAHWTPNTYTIAYTMNNGTDPNPKPTSGTYDSNVSIGTTSIPSKIVTITGNANGTGASVGSATVSSQTFNGWSSSSGAGLGSGAKTGTAASPSTAWNGSTTTNKYFKNLRDTSGTVTLTANWSGTATLPTVTKTGYTCSWYDASGTSGGNYVGASGGSYTVSSGSSYAVTVYAQCTANTYNITLNQQGGSGGTGTIYEKYGDGYYLNNSSGAVSNKMSTSANGVTVPTRSGYTFGGYYTSTNGGGTQYIDANGKLTSSASPTQFSAAGNLYAKWTLNTPATPTISGGATKVYGSSSTTLTCSNSTTYPSGITKKYQFGYASSDGGSPGNWTTESDSNTLTIAANAYVEQRWYSCRVRVYDGSAYSGYATSSTSADTEMTINNATLTFNANNGTGGGTVYTKTGQNVVYDGIRSTTTTSIPTASRPGYDFLGWYDAPSGGNKVLNADGSFTGVAVSGYTSTDKWVATTDKTLYAYWNGITYTITFHYGDTQKNDIPYTSSNTYQTVTIPTTGKYRLEAWGAQGGDSVNDGGSSHSAGAKGAYTSGVAPFDEDDTLYVYVGQRPGYVSSGKADNSGGWNGGGTGRWDHGDNDSAGGGGGATDFRYFGSDTPNLTVNNAVSLRYRIMVAGGGSGNAWSSNPGPGGALASLPRGRATAAVNQTTGNAFGVGGTSSVTGKTKVGNSGGGGGYWGGRPGGARSGNTDDSGQGTGGSSYVSGYTGAVAVISNAANTPRYASDGTTLCADGTTDNTCSIHFTGKVFEDPVMISGESPSTDIIGTDEELEYIMEEPDGIEVYGHTGHGYARVSLDSVQKQVTSGQVIGSPPLPYGNTYWGTHEEEGEDEEGVPFYYSYDIEYDINWAYKAIVETEDEEGNPIYMEEDFPIDLNETYDTLYGTEFYAYGTPHEYSITYEGVSENQWYSGYGPGRYYIEHPSHYNSLDEITIPNPVSGMYNGTYYKFLGWTTQDNLSPTTSFEINKGDYGDLELTANWETKSTFTVRYDGNGGITNCPSGSGSYGDFWYLCTDTPTYGNVQFLGWYTEPTDGEPMGDGTYAYQYQYGHGNYEGDYVLYAHWDIDAIEYNYNISQSFAANRMMNTYYAPDWTKTFEVEIKFSVATASKRYFLFGNYDNSATNALNLEVAQNNTIRVYVGKGTTNATFGSVSTNQDITVKALWNGTTQKLTVDVTGGGTGHYEGTLTALANISGKTNRNFRFGASDYRASSTPFNTINVKNFVIREFYSPPLQANDIVVPDPAGHYYLFEGWTGTNGTTPEYGLTVPTNSEGLISYKANWSTGVSFKAYSKTFSTSNQYIKFKNEVTVVYIDQARRRAYTRERVYFYRTNTGYNTYGQGSMKVKYNWSAGSQTWTVDLAGKKINENGINLWSENWNAYSIGYRTIPYLDNGTRSVTLSVTSFTHAIFSVSTPKNASFSLPAIRAKP